MADAKACPKCKGTMVRGRIMKSNEFSMPNRYLYVWEPDGGLGPDLSKALSGKAQAKSRRGLATYCCDRCGFVEFYGVAAG